MSTQLENPVEGSLPASPRLLNKITSSLVKALPNYKKKYCSWMILWWATYYLQALIILQLHQIVTSMIYAFQFLKASQCLHSGLALDLSREWLNIGGGSDKIPSVEYSHIHYLLVCLPSLSVISLCEEKDATVTCQHLTVQAEAVQAVQWFMQSYFSQAQLVYKAVKARPKLPAQLSNPGPVTPLCCKTQAVLAHPSSQAQIKLALLSCKGQAQLTLLAAKPRPKQPIQL